MLEARDRGVLRIAQEEARRLSHDHVGTEHVLLSLALEKDGGARQVLDACGLSGPRIAAEIQRLVKPLDSPPGKDRLPLTPRAKRALEFGLMEAARFRDPRPRSEHVLLGLLEQGEGLAHRVLKNLGVDPETCRQRAILALGAGKADAAGGADDRADSAPAATGQEPGALERFGVDWVAQAQRHPESFDPLARADVDPLMQVLLRRDGAAALLVGPSGSGKTRRARALAAAIARQSLPLKRMFAVTLPHLLAGARYRGQVEERMSQLFAEAREGADAVLFFDDLELALRDKDVAGALEIALSRFRVSVLGAIDEKALPVLEADCGALLARFTRIAPSANATAKRIAPAGSGNKRTAMFDRLSDRARRAILLARQQAQKLGHEALEPGHLLVGLLAEAEGSGGSLLRVIHLDAARAAMQLDGRLKKGAGRGALEALPFSDAAKSALASAVAAADAGGARAIDVEHVLLGALADPVVAAMLVETGHSLDALKRDVADLLAARRPDPPSGETPGRSRTPALDAFARDLVERARQDRLEPVVGRAAELDQWFEILLRHADGNALIVGPPGAGKSALLRGLALAIAFGRCPPALARLRVFAVDRLALVAGARYRGQLEERVKALVIEAKKAGDVLLCFDDVQALLGEEGATTASRRAGSPADPVFALLKPALDDGGVRFALLIDSAARERFEESYPSLQRHFQIVAVAPATADETLQILRGLKGGLEAYHDVKIDDAALSVAIERCGARREALAFPAGPLALLDQAAARVALQAAEPLPELIAVEAEIARLEQEEAEHVRARDYIKAAAGREVLDSLHKTREQLQRSRRPLRVVDAEAIARL